MSTGVMTEQLPTLADFKNMYFDVAASRRVNAATRRLGSQLRAEAEALDREKPLPLTPRSDVEIRDCIQRIAARDGSMYTAALQKFNAARKAGGDAFANLLRPNGQNVKPSVPAAVAAPNRDASAACSQSTATAADVQTRPERKPAEHILAALRSDPWLITQSGAETLRSIAARENLITPELEKKLIERESLLAAKKAAQLDGADNVQKRDGVAIIDVNGSITRYSNIFSRVSGGTSTDVLATDFTAALNDPTVEAILFNIDSPGGEAKGINEFANMIFNARGGAKPIGGYIGGLAGSAGYWIASAVEPGLLGIDATGWAGSIGAIISAEKSVPGPRDPMTFDFVSKQSPKKLLDPETEAGRTALQRRADSLGQVFVETVARNRGVGERKVLSDFGGGEMLTGQEAVKAGLVDMVTSMEAMVQRLKDNARHWRLTGRRN